MRVVVHSESLGLIKEAAKSRCDGVRFGSEFCEHKLPSLENLKKAYAIVHERDKEFTYVTPMLSNSGVEKIREHLAFLNTEEGVGIVVNDLGALNVVRRYENLRRCLGRQLYRVLARSPWAERIVADGLVMVRRHGHIDQLRSGGFLVRRWYKKLFSQTGLNFPPTIELFRRYGFTDVDLDWIPRIFPSFKWLKSRGLNLSVHVHQVPIAVTRKCHTARFLSEESLEKCTKPCLTKYYILKSEILGLEIYLLGNTIFTLSQPSIEEIRRLDKVGVSDLIFTMTSMTGTNSKKEMDSLLESLNII